MVKENIKSKYYPEMNVLKGLAILFVIIGHSFPDYATGFNNSFNEFIFRLMYSFHMPLFFMISGFLFTKHILKKNTWKEKWHLIQKKFNYLLIPYFTYSLITLVLKCLFAKYAVNSFTLNDIYKIFLSDNPNGGLWFLYVLFFINIIAIILYDEKKWKTYVIFGISILLIFISNYVPFSFYYLARILRNFPFFTLGILINYHYKNFQKIMNKNYILGIFLVIYSCLFLTKFDFTNWNFWMITLAFSGILWSYILASIIGINTKIGKIFMKLSDYAMAIYLLSYFVSVPFKIFATKLNFSYYLIVILNILLSCIIPMILSKYIIMKNKWLNFLLLGKWERENIGFQKTTKKLIKNR